MSVQTLHDFALRCGPRSTQRRWLVLLVLIVLVVLGARSLEAQAQRTSTSAERVRVAAAQSTELRIEISVARRRLWVVSPTGDTLLAAPAARRPHACGSRESRRHAR